MFGIFLFLIYYMQQTLGYSPVVSGVAFLPLIVMVVVSPLVILGHLRGFPARWLPCGAGWSTAAPSVRDDDHLSTGDPVALNRAASARHWPQDRPGPASG